MATAPRSVRVDRASSGVGGRASFDALLLAAPVAGVLAGLAAEFLDFRALRWPLLLMVLAGVTVTSHALVRSRGGWARLWMPVAVGVATWAGAEVLYVILHVVRGTPFESERFGPQPAQALGLIVSHGLLLGAPTGLAASLLLWIGRLRRR
jgi:hypothetical protein